MSCSEHQPNPRKRPINKVAPEFPSIPGRYDLVATQQFAMNSQQALMSVQKDLLSVGMSGCSFVFLPLITIHHVQQRFHVDHGSSVFVMGRKSYPPLKREVDALSKDKHYGIYVGGPAGVGKSYLLYLLAAEYRLNRQSYRVTYINDCATWRGLAYPYLLRELVTCFYDDRIEGKSIVEWCQGVTGSEREEKMMIMVESLINYIHDNNLVWVIICDRHNALYARSVVVEQFPFNVINTLAAIGTHVKVIVSGSANNHGYPIKMNGWHTYNMSSYQFDQQEFKLWCDYYTVDDNMKINDESEEAVDALFWTGGVPYELDLLWKQPHRTLIEKLASYRETRMNEWAKMHSKFYHKLLDEEKEILKECISRMALSLPPPKLTVGMDIELLDIVSDDKGQKIITALNPVAREALISYHGQSLFTFLGLVAKLILKGADYPNAIKGKISVMYITTMLEISQLFAFQFRKVENIAKIGLPGDSIEKRSIEIKSVVHFMKNKLPPITSFRNNVTTLFVPESPNYPRFDFFLWDSERQVMMGFQVTVCNPFSDHPKMTNSEMWQRFCLSNSKQTPMELYWIVPKCCLGTDTASVVNDFIILFEDLISDFPALGKLPVC